MDIGENMGKEIELKRKTYQELQQTVIELTLEKECLNKVIDDIRDQYSELAREKRKVENMYIEVLEDNGFLHRDIQSLTRENEMKCDEIAKLKRRIKGLEQTVSNQKECLYSHYRSIK